MLKKNGKICFRVMLSVDSTESGVLIGVFNYMELIYLKLFKRKFWLLFVLEITNIQFENILMIIQLAHS
jgi:hypothetical protein